MAFVGDQLCSSFRILTDLATLLCFAGTGAYSAPLAAAVDSPAAACLSGPTGALVAVLAGSLPFLVRLIQARCPSSSASYRRPAQLGPRGQPGRLPAGRRRAGRAGPASGEAALGAG